MTEEFLKVLEKYFKIRDKLQQTQAELSRPNLSQAEHAKLETSCRILKSWQKNLEKYAKDCSEDLKEECQTLEKLYDKCERGTLSIYSQVTHPKLFWKTLLS